MINLSRVDELTPIADLQGRMLAAEIIKRLNDNYPGYNWAVSLDETGGVATLFNRTLQSPIRANEMYGYILHLKTVYTDPDMRCVVRAGGEILERANMERCAWDMHTLPTFIEGVKPQHQPILDKNGNPIVLW